MFAKLLPRSCSSLSVFVSYSREQRSLGEEIAQALKNAGHEVFFDLDSIPASGDYNDRIRTAIEDTDRFVFIASQESLTPGKFTLTELEFARQRWPSPEGKVIPVLADARVQIADLPVYLRSISVMSIKGNAVAEVVAAVEKTRKIGSFCKSVTAGAMVAGVLGIAYVGTGLGMRGNPTDIVLMPPQAIHFRPTVDAPLRTAEQPEKTDWASSKMSITVMPVSYTHRTEPGRRARITAETVDLQIGETRHNYRAIYVVEITDAPCGERWYCIKANAGVETLEPGASINRETMFTPLKSEAPSWRQFVDDLLEKPETPIKVTFKTTVEVSESEGLKRFELRQECGIDSQQLKDQLEKAGFTLKGETKPVHVETDCLQQTPALATTSVQVSSPPPKK